MADKAHVYDGEERSKFSPNHENGATPMGFGGKGICEDHV